MTHPEHDQHPGAPPPPAPLSALAELENLDAALKTLHRRALAARADERMQPLGLRDRRELTRIFADLGRLAAGYPHELPELVEPPAGIAHALSDLLPHLAPARTAVAWLTQWHRYVARRDLHPPT